MNLYQFFRSQPGWDRDRVFLRDVAWRRDYTFGDLDDWSARVARWLTFEAGVRPGERVAAQVEKSPQGLFLYLGCLRAGVVWLPLNTAYRAGEVEHFLMDARPRIFFCDPSRAREMADACDRSGTVLWTLDSAGAGTAFDRVARCAGDSAERAFDGAELAAILYTSGTTGRSKGAMLSHNGLRANAVALARAWGFSERDRLLHGLPFFHVHGLFISLHCALVSGASVIWLPRFDPALVLEELPRATVFMGVPTYYSRLLEREGLNPERCAGIRLFVSGSAPLRPEIFEEFERRTGHRILERYGMTETGVIASNPVEGERRPGTVGLPLPGVEARITGPEGMIEVRGESVFQGYWQGHPQGYPRRPDGTSGDFTADGFFRTGDLGRLDGDGYLHIEGRATDLVISGGYNVYPREVELLLDAMAPVAESAVFGVPHADFGEAVVAAVVPRTGARIDEEEMIRELRRRIAAYKTPKRVFTLPELPRNALGKVRKADLRSRFSDTFRDGR